MKKLILFLIVGIFLMEVANAAENSFTPIFCNDYEFTCCGGVKVWSSTPMNISQDNPVQCPPDKIKCKLESFSVSGTWYSGCEQTILTGSLGCHKENPWYSVPYFTCQDERTLNTGSEFNPGTYVWIKHHNVGQCNGIAYLDSWKPQLGFCGESGSYSDEVACGVPVKGADSCQFNPETGKIYSSTDSLNGLVNQASYTVPISSCVLAFQFGNRHICGYKEESCSLDSECNGHTYGNKECNGRKLQTYGCISYGNSLNEKDRGPFDSGWGSDKQKPANSGDADFGKRCEIIKSEDVQCCGDTDCGTNYFCDKNSFTCKENVECISDTDCGVSVQCDWTTNNLKTPVCKNGKCTFEENTVDCCIDKNCQDGGFCDSEHKCQNSEAHQDTIPPRSGNLPPAAVIGGGKSSWLIYVIFAIIILGAIGFFVYHKMSRGSPSVSQQQVAGSAGICKKCGSSLKSGSQFCTNCGNKVDKFSDGENVVCKHCGSSNSRWRKFCTKCGKSLV